jgi:hypothetical protein
MTDKPAIAALLATGRMEILDPDEPNRWRGVDLGLRSEIVAAALRIRPATELHLALLSGRPVSFRDDELDLIVRWSPG